jgi:hypothetical protein
VVLSVSATKNAANGFLTIYPGACKKEHPVVSSVNYRPSMTATNMVISRLASGRKLCVYSLVASTVHLDVTAYLRSSSASQYFPITPQRVVDTRTGTGTYKIKGKVVGGRELKVYKLT